jgi:hypothetical protein
VASIENLERIFFFYLCNVRCMTFQLVEQTMIHGASFPARWTMLQYILNYSVLAKPKFSWYKTIAHWGKRPIQWFIVDLYEGVWTRFQSKFCCHFEFAVFVMARPNKNVKCWITSEVLPYIKESRAFIVYLDKLIENIFKTNW